MIFYGQEKVPVYQHQRLNMIKGIAGSPILIALALVPSGLFSLMTVKGT